MQKIPTSACSLLEAGGSDEVPSVQKRLDGLERKPRGPSAIRLEICGPTQSHTSQRTFHAAKYGPSAGGGDRESMGWVGTRHRTIGILRHPSPATQHGICVGTEIYRRIEEWQAGHQTPRAAETGVDWFWCSRADPNPIAPAMGWTGAAFIGSRPSIEHWRLRQDGGGASAYRVLARDGKRLSVFRNLCLPLHDRPNMTVLTQRIG